MREAKAERSQKAGISGVLCEKGGGVLKGDPAILQKFNTLPQADRFAKEARDDGFTLLRHCERSEAIPANGDRFATEARDDGCDDVLVPTGEPIGLKIHHSTEKSSTNNQGGLLKIRQSGMKTKMFTWNTRRDAPETTNEFIKKFGGK